MINWKRYDPEIELERGYHLTVDQYENFEVRWIVYGECNKNPEAWKRVTHYAHINLPGEEDRP